MHCYVNPEARHIMSATDVDAILLGDADLDNKEKLIPCVIYVPRAIYIAAINAWLDRKADYNKRYGGDWCGVGNIIFSATKINGDGCHVAKHLVTGVYGDPDDPEEFVNVSAYHVTEEYKIDMEHG